MRIIKNPEERRNEILDAAEMLFASKGYSNTTVNDILQKVGIAKGTFYHYFHSKEEVMEAIVRRFIDAGVNAAKSIASDPNLKAPEKIFQIMMAQNPGSSRKEQMIDELHQVENAEMHQKSLVETILQLTPVLAEVIEQGIEEGVFNTPYPKETVEFLLVSSQFLFDEGIFKWEPEELLRKAMALTYIIEKTLGAEEGTFDYVLQMLLSQSSHNQHIQGEEKDE